MLEDLKGLELYILVILCITVALSPFCIKNYMINLIAKVTRAVYTQNTLGMVIDWAWLSCVIFLTIKLG